ncbi:hypothetical protein [Nocardia terpenica]|nr:hypothetical protein [Nocardia terpenica]
MTNSALESALGSFGRRVRRLTPDTMLVADELLIALAGPEAIHQPTDRAHLAEWVVEQLHHLIAALSDDIDRRIAEAVLATRPEFYGKGIGQARAYLRSHHESYVDSAYKRRRSVVIAQLAASLDKAYQLKCAPRVFLSGRYTSEDTGRPIADALGAALATLPITLICGGSRVGAHTAYAMARALRADGTYSPDRTTLYVRTESTRIAPIYQPLGHVIHVDTCRTETRRTMLRNAQLCLVFGGGDFGDADGNGTAEETDLARERGIPIVPLATTGGVAQQLWLNHRADAHRHLPRPRVADYDDLDHRDPTLAITAALHLVTHHLALPSGLA